MIKKLKKRIFYVCTRNRILLVFVLFSTVLIDIFFVIGTSDFRFYGVSISYIFIAIFSKLSSRVSLIFCIFLILMMYAYYLLTGPKEVTEEIAVWFVLFLVAGLIQMLRGK